LRDPESNAEVTTRLNALQIDVLVVAAYGLIIPGSVLEVPPLGCINVHASLLPRWRGAAPIERAIMAGDERTGISIMAMDEGLDTGAVYATAETPIEADDTGDALHDRLAALGGELLLEVLHDLPQRQAQPQTEVGACYATKLNPEEARIDWREPARALARMIQALNSRMPAFATLNGERVRLLSARADDTPVDATPGEILDAGREALRVATAAGTLAVTEVQLSRGKGRVLSIGDALNGNADLLAPGRRFDV
jgi:methionyl-tRNA formyltransferase